MYKRKNIEKAMRSTIKNARNFLKDSNTLGNEGSIGHATSLAILGYEEAHKAYLLSYFLPIFDGIRSEEEREELKGHLLNHSWKQIYANEFRTGLGWLLKSGIITNNEMVELDFPTISELDEGTTAALSTKLNKMKNDGFYSNPFTDPVWNPSDISRKTMNAVQKLLRSQIKSVASTVKWMSWLSFIPKVFLKHIKNEIMGFLETIHDIEAEGVTSLDELRKRLTKHGKIGDMAFELVKALDKRRKQVKREKKQLEKRSKKEVRSN